MRGCIPVPAESWSFLVVFEFAKDEPLDGGVRGQSPLFFNKRFLSDFQMAEE